MALLVVVAVAAVSMAGHNKKCISGCSSSSTVIAVAEVEDVKVAMAVQYC